MKKIIIQKNNSGQRIDKFLKQEIFLNMDMTRGEIIRQIKNDCVLLNEKTTKPSHILKENDELKINIVEKNTELKPNKNIKFGIIYQDENIIVVNKPAGLQVHPGEKNEKDTLVNGLLHKFPEIKNIGDEAAVRPGIVHRLDRDTSGIIVIARNQKTFDALKEKFKNREISKKYLAVVYGKLKNKSGVIEKSIARSKDYKKQTIAGAKTKTKIRPAKTEYKVLKEWENYSLLKVSPRTGRMHQIRIHFSSIGYPIVGDEKYYLKNIKKNLSTKRQLLHSQSINFEMNGKKMEFEAESPEDFRDFIRGVDEKQIKS
jgi:23S rRNA pseudouridine1911/1915/1917 synthase